MKEYQRESNPFNVFNQKAQTQNKIAGHNSLDHPLIKAETAKVKDIYSFPGNRQKAELHQHVSKYGYRSPASEAAKERSCHCCGQTINIEQIKICSSLSPLKEELEEMFPESRQITSETFLFFHFIKMTIIYLLLRILLCFGPKLIANSNSHYCVSNPDQCSWKGLFVLSLWSQTRFNSPELLQIESFINVAYLVIAMIFFVYYRCVQHSYYTNEHSKKYSQQDFTIMVENINFFPFLQHQSYENIQKMPQYYEIMRLSGETTNQNEIVHTNNPNIIISEALKLFFNRQANKWRMKVEKKATEDPSRLVDFELNFFEKLKYLVSDNLTKPVKSVNLCFDMGDLEKVTQLRQKMMGQFVENYKNQGYIDQSSKNYPPNQVLLLAEKEIEIQKGYATTSNPELTLSHFTGTAFISFQYEEYKDFFLKEHSENLKLLYDDQTCLKLSQAAAAEELNWFKIQTKKEDILISVLKGVFVTLLLIAFSFAFFWLLKYWWQNSGYTVIQKGTERRFEVTKEGVWYILVVSFLVKFFSIFIGKIIDFFGQNSGFRTKSEEQIAKIIQKIQSYTILIIVSFIFISEYWSGKAKSWDEVSVTIVLLITKGLVIRTLANFINLSRLKQYLTTKCWYSGQTSSKFQIQLNKIFEYPTFDISQRCAFYVVWMLVGSFFFSVAWISTLLLFTIFIANYWIDKWNLLKRSSSPIPIDKKTGYLLLLFLQLDLVVFALGNFTSMFLVTLPTFSTRNTESDLNRMFHIHLDHEQIAMVGLTMAVVFSLITILLPPTCCRDYKNKTKSYSQTEHMFLYKYWKQNPASRFAEEGKYEPAKNEKEQRLQQVYHKNYSLPVIEMKPNIQTKSKKKEEEQKVIENKPTMHLNLQEIDLSKAYKIGKREENSGSRSSKKRIPVK